MKCSWVCNYATQGQWNGHVDDSETMCLGCSHASNAFRFTRRDSLTHFTKTSSKAFEAVAEVGVAGQSAKVSTEYSHSVMATYWFDLPDTKGFNYCIGGTDVDWNEASRVVVSTASKRTAPGCPSGRHQEVTWSASYRRVDRAYKMPC